jgi:hypothetical protein
MNSTYEATLDSGRGLPSPAPGRDGPSAGMIGTVGSVGHSEWFTGAGELTSAVPLADPSDCPLMEMTT